jgi:hypothetical protein
MQFNSKANGGLLPRTAVQSFQLERGKWKAKEIHTSRLPILRPEFAI